MENRLYRIENLEHIMDQSLLRAIGHFRAQVWHNEGVEIPDFSASDPDCWLDTIDYTARHWLIRLVDTGEIIASARFSIHSQFASVPDMSWLEKYIDLFTTPIGSFNRLVVKKEYRNSGLAKLLDEARLEFAVQMGVRTNVVIAVGENRVRALEKLGFKLLYQLPKGHGLMTPEIPHFALYWQSVLK